MELKGRLIASSFLFLFLFLIHRVELKVWHKTYSISLGNPFLIHRVELKDGDPVAEAFSGLPFLIHRVELKGLGSVSNYDKSLRF